MSRVIIFYKNNKIDEYIFSETEISIGRSVENHILLDDHLVSRKHAIIKLVDNAYVLTDLGSENGTILNGENIITEVLKNNDQIEIGPFRLICQIEVFESLLQHLSSQINPLTGDTDPGFALPQSHITKSPAETHSRDDDDQFFDTLNSYAFYGAIVVLIVLIIAAVLFLETQWLTDFLGTN